MAGAVLLSSNHTAGSQSSFVRSQNKTVSHRAVLTWKFWNGNSSWHRNGLFHCESVHCVFDSDLYETLYLLRKKKVELFFGGRGGIGQIIGRIYFYVWRKKRNGYLCPANLKCISIMHIFTLGFFIIYGTRHVFKFYGPSRLLYFIKLKLHHDRTRLYIISDKIKYLV